MSFQQRIQESTDAHNKLQSHLSKTMQEIYDQEKHVEALKQAIRMKGNPLKVAQTRLEARCHRPDVELCRDPPHHRLVEEVTNYSFLYTEISILLRMSSKNPTFTFGLGLPLELYYNAKYISIIFAIHIMSFIYSDYFFYNYF